MLLLAYFDIFDYGVQILMQMFFYQFWVSKVKHLFQITSIGTNYLCNKYISLCYNQWLQDYKVIFKLHMITTTVLFSFFSFTPITIAFK